MRTKLLLFLLIIPFFLWGQEESENNGAIIETKVGAELNWNFGKRKQFLLVPSLKSVHNNRKNGDSWASYQGMAAEVYFSMPVVKYLRFFADVELDLSETATSHTTFSTGFNSSYTIKRFSVSGEFKYSTDRSLHYVDRERDPYFKYTVAGGVYVIENIWKFSAQVMIPHCLRENAITGIDLQGISNFFITDHFGINFTMEWSDTFANGRNFFSPQLSAVFRI